VIHARRQRRILRRRLVGRALGDALFDHAQHLLVGRPEGLADADGVVDDLR
jgi:hypothetical protein